MLQFRPGILDAEAVGGEVREKAIDQPPQLGRALRGLPAAWRPSRDERPDAASRLEHAIALEVRVDLRDGVRVDLEVHRELTHRRQLLADGQPSRGNRRENPSFQLCVNRGPIRRVELQRKRHTNNVLLH